jgi:hypothetical protein
MKLAIRPLAITCAIVWGGTVLVSSLANLFWPPYAKEFLQMLASIYPGYTGEPTFGGVLNVTLYALLDGAVGGLIIAWLYNLLVGKCGDKKETQ